MTRDRRLLIALLLFSTALIAGLIQSWIVRLYLNAAIMGHWTWFADTFGVPAPARGPDIFCFDYCAPRLPFLAGWIGITSFVAELVLLALAWWRSKR
jgi:hypothetical protein